MLGGLTAWTRGLHWRKK